MLKSVLWAAAVGLGLVAVIAAFALGTLQSGVAVGIAVVASWVAIAYLLSYQASIRRPVLKHLRVSLDQVASVTHSVEELLRVDYYRALENLQATGNSSAQTLAVEAGSQSLADAIGGSVDVQPQRRHAFSSGVDSNLDCITNGVYRLYVRDRPYVAYVGGNSHLNDDYVDEHRGGLLEILAPDDETAKAGLQEVIRWVQARSMFRGSTITLESHPGQRVPEIKFFDLAPVRRESIVLPEEVLTVVERNVLGLLRSAESLRQAGRSTRHGVLLCGAPGTGKTLVTRYLATVSPDYTVIVLTGRNLPFIRESFRLAKLLAPSMLIIEDVDLVAAERRENQFAPFLHDLLDEMDGLGRKTDCILVLTTNRPEILEPALAARPGRVDQAIYFPLPDAECRRRLCRLFGEGLSLAAIDVEGLVEKTDGASPAFLEELFRRAALLAVERGEQAQPLALRGEDFERGLHEIVQFGGELTKNLLGFRARTGFQ